MVGSKIKRPAPDYERVRHLVTYWPETGDFWWRVPKRGSRLGGLAGSKDKKGYITICLDGVHYFAQRLAWFYMTTEWPPHDVDHRNLDRGDNRFQNLRPATRAQNLANRNKHSNNQSGLKGVLLHKQSGLWVARIGVSGESIYLGYFKTKEEAHAAYAAAATKHYGEFARLS